MGHVGPCGDRLWSDDRWLGHRSGVNGWPSSRAPRINHHARWSDINRIPILLPKRDQVLDTRAASTLTSFAEALWIDVEAPPAGMVLRCRGHNDAAIAAFQIVDGVARAE